MTDLQTRPQVPWDRPLVDKTVSETLRLCGLSDDIRENKSLRLLDFGCGNGRYLEVFGQVLPAAHVFGIESDLEQIRTVRKKGFTCYPTTPNLPFEDGSLDVIYSSNVVEHIPRQQYLVYLKEFNRVLKPGGRFVVGTPNYPWKRLYDLRKAIVSRLFRYYLLDDPTHCNRLSFRRLESDLSPYFSEIHLSPTYIAFEPLIARLGYNRIRFRAVADKIVGYCIK